MQAGRLFGLAGGLITGAALAGLLQALLFPGFGATELLREKLALLWTGNFLAAAVLGAGVAVLAPLLARQRPAATMPSPALGFWLGTALGAGPLVVSALDLERRPELLGSLGIGLAVMAALLLLAPRLAQRAAPPAAVLVAAGPAILLVYAALWLLPPADPGQAPALPLPAAAGGGDRTGPRPPDLILIAVDTLRADAVLRAELDTPRLDAMRAAGRWAPFGLAPSPMTLPSHASMLTGLGPLQHGAISNRHVLPAARPTVQAALQEAGYRTAGVVSNGVLRGSMGFIGGFDVYDDLPVAIGEELQRLRVASKLRSWFGWLPLPGKTSEGFFMRRLRGPVRTEADGPRTAAVACHYMEELQQEAAPYFLFVNFMEPHTPYEPDESVRGTRTSAKTPPAPLRVLYPDAKDLRAIQDGVGVAAAAEAVAYAQQLYDEEVIEVDRLVGAILDQARAGGRETVILFTSDHGEQFGEHGKLLHGNTLYETLLQVPFILLAPDLEPGSRFPLPPQLEDVAPTLLAYAGVPRPAGMGGRNLRLPDMPDLPQVAVLTDWIAVRSGDRKLIAQTALEGAISSALEAAELYDLRQDPAEARNLLPGAQDEIEHLVALGLKALREASLADLAELSPAEEAMLQELGYVEGH